MLVYLINAQGQTVREWRWSAPTEQFELQDLPAGLYQLQVPEIRRTITLVKQ